MRRPLRRAVGPIAAAVSLALAAPHALAWWSDTGTATLPPVSAHTVLQPAGPMTCDTENVATQMVLTVPHLDDRYAHYVQFYNNSGTTALGPQFPMTRSGNTWSRTITRTDAGLINLLTPLRARVYSRLTSEPSWTSADYREWQVSFTGLSILVVLFGCTSNTR